MNINGSLMWLRRKKRNIRRIMTWPVAGADTGFQPGGGECLLGTQMQFKSKQFCIELRERKQHPHYLVQLNTGFRNKARSFKNSFFL